MSLVTISTQRNRIYHRRFPHEEAISRYQSEKISLSALAREYGVSPSAIKRVVDPETRERMRQATIRKIMSGVCCDCGKKGISQYAKRCVKCSGAKRATSVRTDSLKCVTCHVWKPDEGFAHSKTETVRRGRHTQCRKCSSVTRTSYRERHKIPCEGGCGTMVEGKGRAKCRGNPDRPYLCRACWAEQRSGGELNRLFAELGQEDGVDSTEIKGGD